jgi:regulator of nucleoside diphosphate kinase
MMFRRKKTITRQDRDRLVEVKRTGATALQWALFVDKLQTEIDRARVVESKRVAHDVVTMHSKVRLRDPERRKAEVYTLVYPEEANLNAGNLSVLSSVGTAILGARQGDVLRVVGATGHREIKVEAVLFQPEGAVDERRAIAACSSSASSCSSLQGNHSGNADVIDAKRFEETSNRQT